MQKETEHGRAKILQSPQAAKLLGNPATLAALIASPDTKQLLDLLNHSAGGNLQGAAQRAAKGDMGELMGLISGLTKDPKGAKIVEDLQKNMQK